MASDYQDRYNNQLDQTEEVQKENTRLAKELQAERERAREVEAELRAIEVAILNVEHVGGRGVDICFVKPRLDEALLLLAQSPPAAQPDRNAEAASRDGICPKCLGWRMVGLEECSACGGTGKAPVTSDPKTPESAEAPQQTTTGPAEPQGRDAATSQSAEAGRPIRWAQLQRGPTAEGPWRTVKLDLTLQEPHDWAIPSDAEFLAHPMIADRWHRWRVIELALPTDDEEERRHAR